MMEYDITLLTFLPDPSQNQANSESIVVSLPPGIVRKEELFTSLYEQLPSPPSLGKDWNALNEGLCFWTHATKMQCVMIIHHDIPFLDIKGKGWYPLQIYLRALIRNISWIREHLGKELVVIFPSDTYETLSGVLTHPPVWEMVFGFYEQSVQMSIDPAWSEIARALACLNGLTAEICTIMHADIGSMTIHYFRKTEDYSILCNIQGSPMSLLVSVVDTASFSAGLSFFQAQQVVEEFFRNRQRSISVHWLALDHETYRTRIEALERLSYLSDEEACIIGRGSTVRETIIQGILHASPEEENVFSRDYWRKVLLDQDVPVSQHITALCVIGSSDLPEKSALLLPFLESSVKKERWVSACFLGMMGNEQAKPTLFSMLTEEPPLLVKASWAEQDSWYEDWRSYAPALLRQWQTVEVLARLQQALAQWIEAEPFFDPEYSFWRAYEAELCYELGYRGDFTLGPTGALEEDHRQMLMVDTARGYLTASKKLSLREEQCQRNAFWSTYRLIQEDLLSLLTEKCGFARSIAETVLEEYSKKNEYTF